MGFADRDYYRAAPPSGGVPHFRTWSVTIWLVVINVAVFFAEALVRNAFHFSLATWGDFNTYEAIVHLQLWRFITFQFLHANVSHILFNMMGLYCFGPIIESYLGPRKFVAFYLLCGIAGAVTFIALAGSHAIDVSEQSRLVGASAGIFGLLVASAILAPNAQIILIVFTVTIRTAAILAMLMAAYVVIASGDNVGGEAAHLGGGVFGYILIKNIRWLNFVEPGRRSSMYIGTRRRRGFFNKDWSKDTDH